jgi:hypothetical protein
MRAFHPRRSGHAAVRRGAAVARALGASLDALISLARAHVAESAQHRRRGHGPGNIGGLHVPVGLQKSG